MALKINAGYGRAIFYSARDKGLGGSRIIHEGIQFTTDTTALLSYLLAWLLSQFRHKLNQFKRSEQSIIILIVNDYMVVRRQQLLTDIRQCLLV